MIENYLQESAKNKENPFFDSINQFKDPNLIQPGAKLNLEEIRAGLTKMKFPVFGGETLLEHAKALKESTSASGVFSSAQAASLASQPYPPISPAEFGVVDVPAREVGESVSGQFSGPTKEVGESVSGSYKGPVTTPVITPEAAPLPPASPQKIPDNVLLDSYGGIVTDSSGNPIKTGDVEINRY